MDACPDFIGVVKIFALTRDVHVPRPKGQLGSCPILLSCRITLELEPRLNIKTDLTGQAKLNIFQRSHSIHVNGPWCITFEWEEGEALRVNLEQYH